MTDLKFAASASALCKAADSLLVVAPKSAFARRGFLADALPEEVRTLAVRIASGLAPGDLGAAAETWTTGKPPLHLEVGVLPDEVSRHHSPARPECVRSVVAGSKRRGERQAVLAVVDHADHALAVTNAIARGLPGISLKSGAEKKGRTARVSVLVTDRRGKALRADPIRREVALMSRAAARLVDTPPTDLDPGAMAREARRLLRGLPDVKIQEIRGDKLLAARLGAIHAVGRAARTEPRLLIASYRPSRATGAHIALVGKGITYDTGGLHLKPRGGMETMKGDMGGSAATLGAFRVLAVTGARARITLLLCLAENAIGHLAYKPDDVLTLHSGKTVEINNTDAEGRLVLADGVSYASRVLGADVILDAATLTGAQMIATGTNHAAVVSNDAKLEAILVDAGRHSGDLVHPLPFAPEFYKAEFKSPIADMRNSVKDRMNAQASCAAQFIWWHIEDTAVRWAHIDMAGPAMRGDRGTGYGVALLAEAVRRLV